MSSALKPALPQAGGQSSPSNVPSMAHSTPASYSQLPPPNPATMSAMNQPLPQATAVIPNAHMGPSKAAVLPTIRPNMLPYMSSMQDNTTLPATQNAAQLMQFHKGQSNGTPGLDVCKPTAPAQQQQQPVVPDIRPEPPVVPVQNHVPASHETAKQPEPVVEKPAVVLPAPQPLEKPLAAEEPKKTASLPTVAPAPPPPPPPPPPPTVTQQQQAPAATAAPAEAAMEAAQPAPSAPSAPSPASVAPVATVMKTATIPKETPKPVTTLKLATTPRTVTRKRETKAKAAESPEESPKGISPAKSDKSVTSQKAPSPKSKARISDEEQKSKRTRTRTQPYQSPIPELAFITKLSNSASKNNDDKLIVFYKNEFLAVRNAEGSFYVCQAVQNVYKSSPRIRIRWLSQDKNDKTYAPDFYDVTDFDCILTNLNMERVEKGKFNLPKDELERTENILKRALAVESGDAAPSLTEEHPDGLDLSLFRDESQLKKKRKATKRKSTGPLTESDGRNRKSPAKSKVRKVSKSTKAKKNNQTKETTTNNVVMDKKMKAKSETGRAERAKRRQETSPVAHKTSPVLDQKKARVLAKVAMKTAVSQPKSLKKVKKAVAAVPAKVAAVAIPSSSKTTKTTRSQAPPSTSSTRRGKTNKK